MQAEIYYKLNWHPGSTMPGQHRSATLGDGFEFDTHAPLGDGVDPRRFDLLASSRDPLERILVRRYRQTSAVDVTVIADMSASMLTTRSIKKMDIVASLTRALTRSVYRNGDYFAFYGCTDTLLPAYTCPRSRDSYHGYEVASKLEMLADENSVSDNAALTVGAVEQAASRLPVRRGVVFFVSDFHITLSMLDTVLQRFGRHMVVPLLIEDSVESSAPPAFGFTELIDIETGNRRSYFMRPVLRKRYIEAFAKHRLDVREICERRGCPLLKLVDTFAADDISKYFMEY